MLGDDVEKCRIPIKHYLALYIGGMGDYYKELLTDLGYGEDAERVDIAYKVKETRKEAWKTVPDDLMNALMIAGGGPDESRGPDSG